MLSLCNSDEVGMCVCATTLFGLTLVSVQWSQMAQRGNNDEQSQNVQNQHAAIMAQTAAVLVGLNNNVNQLHQQMQQNNNAGVQGGQESRGLDEFCRRNPEKFAGGYAPDAATAWIEELEKIFEAMQCPDDGKVRYAVYMLIGEAADWWRNTVQVMELQQQAVTWASFKGRFLGKYFPVDVRRSKEIEFMHLTQGKMSVGEYTAKFEELVKYVPHYNLPENEGSKCAKYLDGMREELQLAFVHLGIESFPLLATRCRMYERKLPGKNTADKTVAPSSSHGPVRNFHNNQNQGRENPYGGGSYHHQGSEGINRFKRSGFQGNNPNHNNNNYRDRRDGNNNLGGNRGGHNGNGNNNDGGHINTNNAGAEDQGGMPPHCNLCNRNHYGPNCPYTNPNCFNCNQPGHIAKNCQEPKREQGSGRPAGNGRVFAMSGNRGDNTASRS